METLRADMTLDEITTQLAKRAVMARRLRALHKQADINPGLLGAGSGAVGGGLLGAGSS